ncbi:MAG TPA: nuclear transport factor 2 family protein [Thermoplasmata archaeon]
MTQLTELEARQMIAVVNTRNVEKVVAQYAENASFQVPNLESPIQGKEAIRSYLTGAFAAFPDWTMDINNVIVSGNEAIVVNSVHGTHTGPFTDSDGKAVTPTNKSFVQDQLTRVVVDENGKVSLYRAYGNPSRMNRLLRSPNASKQSSGPMSTSSTESVTPPVAPK